MYIYLLKILDLSKIKSILYNWVTSVDVANNPVNRVNPALLAKLLIFLHGLFWKNPVKIKTFSYGLHQWKT